MKLAINGGSPIRINPFPAYVTVGEEEKEAVAKVIDSGILSRYLGAYHEQFRGGTEVRALEREWAQKYNVRHAFAVNSASSGIICALGALGIGPGDEVIVTPWSMCISATAPLFYGALPVFADIEKDYFCIDPKDIERKITPKTRAIIAVDIFGQPYDADAINEMARKHDIPVIEDAAQAPGATLHGKYAGTFGTLGIFSLNYHKHIQCGEGGIIVTNDDNLARRVSLIRNHAEAVVEGMGENNLVNMLGYNFRMTELEAAVARCQLRKLDSLNNVRLKNVKYLENGLKHIPCLEMPKIRPDAKHVYYIHACKFDEKIAGVSGSRFVEAIKAELPSFRLREKEGTKLGCGYVKPLYMMPIFQQKIAIGNDGWPFNQRQRLNYTENLCPICEQMYNGKVLTHEFMLPSMKKEDLNDVIEAFNKVWENRNELY